MWRRVNAAILAVIVLYLANATGAGANTVYDAAGDFSIDSNPNGVWTYGSEPTIGGSFTPFVDSANTTDAFPEDSVIVWQGTWYSDPYGFYYPHLLKNVTNDTLDSCGFILLPGQLAMHPANDGALCVTRFTTPSDGFYHIDSVFEGRDARTTTSDVHVLLNGTSLLNGYINGFGPSTDMPFDAMLWLHQGDTVDFLVGWGENYDYTFDGTSLSATVTVQIPGDANGDGRVNGTDAQALATNWGKTSGATWQQGDFNGDGVVNGADASILAANWGYGAGGESAAVPEPSAIALLATGVVGFVAAGRRRLKGSGVFVLFGSDRHGALNKDSRPL